MDGSTYIEVVSEILQSFVQLPYKLFGKNISELACQKAILRPLRGMKIYNPTKPVKRWSFFMLLSVCSLPNLPMCMSTLNLEAYI